MQGVGFRPTVKRHADACDIAGSVSNKGPYVEIFAEGSEECVHSFIKQIQEEPPKRAVILKLDVENVESGEDGIHKVESETDSKEKFQIIESEKKKEKSSYPQTLPFARNVRRNFMIRTTEDICIRLSIVPVVDRVLQS